MTFQLLVWKNIWKCLRVYIFEQFYFIRQSMQSAWINLINNLIEWLNCTAAQNLKCLVCIRNSICFISLRTLSSTVNSNLLDTIYVILYYPLTNIFYSYTWSHFISSPFGFKLWLYLIILFIFTNRKQISNKLALNSIFGSLLQSSVFAGLLKCMNAKLQIYRH